MYTLKYILQPKQKPENGLEKTRAQFSKGIGLAYLTTKVYEYHTEDYEQPILTTQIGGVTVALPRYYRTKIFTKYQLAVEASRYKWKSIRERRIEMRRLIKLGIKNTHAYRQRLRIDQALRIIEKTKYHQTL